MNLIEQHNCYLNNGAKTINRIEQLTSQPPIVSSTLIPIP